MEAKYTREIYDSIGHVDTAEWHSLVDASNDLAMNPRLIQLLENTLSDQARFWIVIIRDAERRLAACACLCLFQTDVAQSSPKFLFRLIQNLRRRWPNFLKLKVLFCGLPFPAGHTHLRIHPALDSQPILQLLNQTMIQLARQEKARLLVFKELAAEQDEQMQPLHTWGFMRGELEPVYRLTRSFKNFKEYQNALRSCYRRQIQANVKKFIAAGLQVEHIFNAEHIDIHFTESVYQLYLNVWVRVKEKLECFSVEFFRGLAKVFPNQVILTLIRDKQRPVAFSIGLLGEDYYHNLYVGLDYSYLERTDLYFNLFYHELDTVFSLNKSQISLGQTSGSFKSRLGAAPDPRFFWVRPLNPILRYIFKYCRHWIFPKMNLIKKNQVFKNL